MAGISVMCRRERGVGMVFQDYALYSHWNVRDNLAFYFKLRKREPEVPEKVKEAAEILGVDFDLLLGRLPKNLSVGQRQQVAIARCLVRDPKIFLMDEPFSKSGCRAAPTCSGAAQTSVIALQGDDPLRYS